VDLYEPIPDDLKVAIELKLESEAEIDSDHHARLWCDVLEPTTAQVIAHYKSEFYADRAAATWNSFGQGHVLYVGTFGDEKLHETLIGWLSRTAGISPIIPTPNGVEATQRRTNNSRIVFLLNHSDMEQEIFFEEKFHDLIDEKIVQGMATIKPKAVLILRAESKV
jgi:beta-galactosidase